MRKILILLIMMQFVLFASVGKIVAMRGSVTIDREGSVIKAVSGTILENKDTVKTEAKSKAQLKFTDGTVITLGKNSLFSINDYISEEKNIKADFSVTKGFFKSITGRIGKIAPNKFKLRTRTATIGIRGTIFLGEISNDVEKIACTDGAIDVTVGSDTQRVDAGEMIIIESGKPPSPPSAIDADFLKNSDAKVKDIEEKIDKLETSDVNSAEVQDLVSEISELEDLQIREQEAALNDKLYNNFLQLLEGVLYKVTPPTAYQTGYVKDSSYDGINWGFFTTNRVSQDKSIDFSKRLSDAIPQQMWMKTISGENIETLYTPTQTITDYIGYTDATDLFAPHWDASISTERTLGIYNGKVLAISNYNDSATISADTDSALISATDGISLNKTTLRIDYGNKSWNAMIKFDIVDPKNGGTDHWIVYSAGVGEANLTPSAMQNVLYIQADGSEVLSSLEMTLRYLGPSTQQISSLFNFYNNNGSKTYGNIVFNKQELITLTPKELDSNTNFSWGYWAQNELGTKSDEDILAANPSGGWVKASATNGITSVSEINTLISNNQSASYLGTVAGTVHNNMTNGVELMSNGSANFNFNFGNQVYTGNLNFDTPSEHWNLDVAKGTLSTAGFQAGGTNVFSATTSNTAGTPIYGEMNGKFYGTDAASVAGGFEVMSYTAADKVVKTAIGAFSAAKQ